jgi:hypothetical protein
LRAVQARFLFAGFEKSLQASVHQSLLEKTLFGILTPLIAYLRPEDKLSNTGLSREQNG